MPGAPPLWMGYYDNLSAVSCASARACASVGNYGNHGLNGLSKTLTMVGTSGS